MKPVYLIGILCITIALIFCAGCTSSQLAPPQSAPATPVPTPATTTIVTPVPTATPYPGALPMNQLAAFGKADRTGTATVYNVKILPNYTWSDPSFNSPHDQLKAGDTLLSIQYGYNTQKPEEGNVYLFVYVRLTDTGTTGIPAPYPTQFIVNYDGKDYSYRSIHDPRITVGNNLGSQYDYEYETGSVVGYILPGDGNAAEGFLIYEVPATIDIGKAVLVITLDADNQIAWALS